MLDMTRAHVRIPDFVILLITFCPAGLRAARMKGPQHNPCLSDPSLLAY